MAGLEGCIFSNGSVPCRKVTVVGVKLCPRHDALVNAFGMEDAQGREYGYACDSCSDKSDVKLDKCKKCHSKACVLCRKHGICCVESEIDEAEDNVRELEGRLNSLRRDRNKVIANA